jgi:3-hydroxyanthranilate 3,4-dioxygenase
MHLLPPINFKHWIEDHRHLLKPPVGNQVVWENREFIIMVVGGPNAREDYHVNQSDEFFYQLEGNIILKVIEDGHKHDIAISEGDIFLLPPRIPHSPQRPANTVGLVVERKRKIGELDGFQWYCNRCEKHMHSEFIQLENIVTQLPPLFDRFYQNPVFTTCKHCGEIKERR